MHSSKIALLAAVAALICTNASAQQPVKASVRYLSKPVNIDVPAMRGVTTVQVFFAAAEYTIRGGGIFDGARGVISQIGDVHGDTILLEGVAKFDKAGSTYVNRWSGHCLPLKSGTGTVMTCAGGWFTLPGATGQFANLVASGTWKGTMTPEGDFDAEWDAVYTK